ncbi:MAG TPA: FAD/NAD(P)-binding protein [candidate division Zixibacteria bacterium]|nr:FAD/NAD(P)-binding protein [candidate division Zixibacteria bacterium]HQL22856.1 FAD/NAD(P)-binding protein [candidate division Zixibacteria bacterium]
MAITKTNAAAESPALLDPMLGQPYRIGRVVKETYDTFTLELAPTEEGNGFAFLPGQFNMLYVYGVGEVPISISGDPAKPRALIHTTRAVGSVTKQMQKLRKGDVIGVRGPYGTAWPVEEAKGRDVVVVAGGIGLAPLRPTLYHLLKHRKRYGKVILLYGARTPDDVLYPKMLAQWGARPEIEVLTTVDRGMGQWTGNVGVVTTLVPKVTFDAANCLAMACGPEVMMRFTALALSKRGLADEQIYVSMERNMKCGIGLCGHCQTGSLFVCKDGPVFRLDRVKPLFTQREI